MPYVLDPQVAGELGDETVMDGSTHPPTVTRVDYVLDQPDADEFIQSFPVFLVSLDLGARLQQAGMTGFDLADALVRPSVEYLAAFGDVPHRLYSWLRVHGTPEVDDCWLDQSLQICVSDRMMSIIETTTLSDCLVEELGS
jgi:hypothetical protein